MEIEGKLGVSTGGETKAMGAGTHEPTLGITEDRSGRATENQDLVRRVRVTGKTIKADHQNK